MVFTALFSFGEERVVARVNGVELTEGMLDEMVNRLISMTFYHGTLTPERKDMMRQKAMDELIKRELYLQEAVKTIKIKGSEVKDALKDIRSRFKSKRAFEMALKREGYTSEGFKKRIERDLLINKFFEREVIEKSKVSDKELMDYYEKNKGDFLRPEAWRLRHILIKVEPQASHEERERLRGEAEEVLQKAKMGEDFSGLAYRYSMDDWRVKGGDLGIVHKGRLDPLLEDAISRLKVGEISDIIKTEMGYHIIRLDEKVTETQLGFEEVKERLRRKIEGEKREELEEALLKRLKGDAKIEIY